MTTVVGLYPSLVDAQQTIADLIDAGFERPQISFVMGKERIVDAANGRAASVVVDDGNDFSITCPSGEQRRVLVAGPLALTGPTGPLLGSEWAVSEALRDAGLGPFAVSGLVEAICAGAILVAVRCEDRRIRAARDILDTTSLSEIPTATVLERMYASAASAPANA